MLCQVSAEQSNGRGEAERGGQGDQPRAMGRRQIHHDAHSEREQHDVRQPVDGFVRLEERVQAFGETRLAAEGELRGQESAGYGDWARRFGDGDRIRRMTNAIDAETTSGNRAA